MSSLEDEEDEVRQEELKNSIKESLRRRLGLESYKDYDRLFTDSWEAAATPEEECVLKQMKDFCAMFEIETSADKGKETKAASSSGGSSGGKKAATAYLVDGSTIEVLEKDKLAEAYTDLPGRYVLIDRARKSDPAAKGQGDGEFYLMGNNGGFHRLHKPADLEKHAASTLMAIRIRLGEELYRKVCDEVDDKMAEKKEKERR